MQLYRGYSRSAAQALRQALTLAGRQGLAQAGTGHLLAAILQQGPGPATAFLRAHRITAEAVDRRVEALAAPGASAVRSAPAPELRKTMEFAKVGARSAHIKYVQTEHLLCAMLEDPGCTACLWLTQMGVETGEAARECRQLSGQLVLPLPPPRAAAPARASRASEKYGQDLTRMAAEGALDPVFCREEELARLEEILCRRR